jgi:hypothetical protein
MPGTTSAAEAERGPLRVNLGSPEFLAVVPANRDFAAIADHVTVGEDEAHAVLDIVFD